VPAWIVGAGGAGNPSYNPGVLERTQVRALPVLNRAVDVSPAVQACCGVCRTCVTTNVVTLVTAGVTGAALYLARLVKRHR
jgi:hypothetical protein